MQKTKCLVALIFWVTFAGTTLAAGGERYADKDKGFSVMLPKKWEIKKSVMGAEVIALRPKSGPKDNFRENINVVVENLTEKMTAQNYFKASQNVLQKVFTEFKVEKQGHTSIDHHDVYWAIFSHKMAGVRAKVLQYMTVDGTKGYVVTGSALPKTFNKYRKDFEMVAMSLKLTPSEVVKK